MNAPLQENEMKPRYRRMWCQECQRETIHFHNECMLCCEKPVTLEQEQEAHPEVGNGEGDEVGGDHDF